MAEPEKRPEDVPFSISCYECDCASPESMEQAIRDGWTEIQFTPDGLAENFLGYCPEHSAELEADKKS
jgi:hypothetical protein